MAYLNEVRLIGNVGRDVEVRYMPNGDAVANFSLATTKRVKGKEYTEWHSLTAYTKLAEIAAKYVKKGREIFVAGELRTNKWEKDGAPQYRTEIVVTNLQLLGPRSTQGNDQDHEQGSSEVPPSED